MGLGPGRGLGWLRILCGSAATQQGQIFVRPWLSSPNQGQLLRPSPWPSSAYPGKKELREVLAPFSPFLGLSAFVMWQQHSTSHSSALFGRAGELGMEDEGIRACYALCDMELTTGRFAPCQHCALQTGVLVTFPSHMWTSGVNQSPQIQIKVCHWFQESADCLCTGKFPGLD